MSSKIYARQISFLMTNNKMSVMLPNMSISILFYSFYLLINFVSFPTIQQIQFILIYFNHLSSLKPQITKNSIIIKRQLMHDKLTPIHSFPIQSINPIFLFTLISIFPLNFMIYVYLYSRIQSFHRRTPPPHTVDHISNFS